MDKSKKRLKILNDVELQVFDRVSLEQIQESGLLKARAKASLEATSKETQRAWQSDWANWLSFTGRECLDYDRYHLLAPDHRRRRPIPADPRLIRDYIAYYSPRMRDKKGDVIENDTGPKSIRRYKPATLRRIVSSIAKAHDMLGYSQNPAHDSIVSDTLNKYSRRRKQQRQAKPIQWKDIREFLRIDIPPEAKQPNTAEYRHLKKYLDPQLISEGHWLRARAMFCLAYNSLARREELVGIQLGHIQFDDDAATVYLPYVKGDKDDYRHLSNISLKHLRAWLAFAKIEEGPIFCQFQRNGGVRLRADRRGNYQPRGKQLNATEVNKIFKSCMRAIGRNDDVVSGISGHSCRIGAAIDLEQSGASLPEIMAAGGWASPTMPNRYTRGARPSKGAMARMSRDQERSYVTDDYDEDVL